VTEQGCSRSTPTFARHCSARSFSSSNCERWAVREADSGYDESGSWAYTTGARRLGDATNSCPHEQGVQSEASLIAKGAPVALDTRREADWAGAARVEVRYASQRALGRLRTVLP
jgi:hypothetical protein